MAHLPNRPIAQSPTNLRIVFFGTPRLAQIILEKLIDSPYKPSLVVTAVDTKAGRGHKTQSSPVKQTALEHKFEVLQPNNLSDKNFQFSLSTRNSLKASIFNFQFDFAILTAYGKIVPSEILKIPKYGFINVHPSLLPKYRGPSPIQSAILADEKFTGVSIIKLDEEIDHGPMLAQEEIGIKSDDTHASLIEKLGKLGAGLLNKTLPEYLEGRLKPKPQNHTLATFTNRITKSDGLIDLHNPPNPLHLSRMIRAYYPWPGVWTRLQTTNYKLQTIKFLPENLIQPEGKRAMTIAEFKNGYPQAYEQIKHLFSQKAQS